MYYVLAFLFPPLAQILCEEHKIGLLFTLPLCLFFTAIFWLPGAVYAIHTAVRPHYKRRRIARVVEQFRQQKLRDEPLAVG